MQKANLPLSISNNTQELKALFHSFFILALDGRQRLLHTPVTLPPPPPRGKSSRYITYNNQLDALISQIYSWTVNLHVSDSSSVHRQEFFTVHTAMVYVIQVC